jgi:hypothetical protein
MKVKVVKAKLNTYWYANRIGEVFDVVEINKYDSAYKVIDKELYFVGEDVEIIDEQPNYPFFVRCIDAEQSDGYLEFGKIYKAIGDCYGSDHFLEGVHATWSKDRFEIVKEVPVQQPPLTEQNVEQEYTGGSVSYYSVPIDHPTDPEKNPYTAECNDIIEALGMNYAEGNAFKAIWRSCAARKLGNAKKGYDDGLYDAEKVVFFGQRMVAMAKQTKMVLDFDPIS